MFRERFRYDKQRKGILQTPLKACNKFEAVTRHAPKKLAAEVWEFPGRSAATPKKGLQRVGTNTQVSDPASFAGRHFCAFVIAKAPTSRKLFSVQQTSTRTPPHPAVNFYFFLLHF